LEEQDEAITQREDKTEDLADEVEALRLDIEEMQRCRDAESIERSQSHAQILEEREEHDAVEDDLNSLRDKLAAATIELQQKEDEIEMKVREIDELVSEHDRILGCKFKPG
jgi:chromosome segregation ATPase